MDGVEHLTNERGIGLVVTVLVMVALFAATAVGVGVGRHAFTATEVQSVAEVAATAAVKEKVVARASDDDSRTVGRQVTALNQIDGVAAEINSATLKNLIINFGSYDGNTFRNGGDPVNSAKVTAQGIVPSLFPISIPGIFDVGADPNGKYIVEKNAMATFYPLGKSPPSLPIALCSGCFQNVCTDGSCLTLTFVPSADSGNSAAWTAFHGAVGSSGDIEAYFPSPCGQGQDVPTLLANTGDRISLNNGQQNAARNAWCMACTLDPPQTIFLLPVFDCAQCRGPLNQTAAVVGFATIQIDSFWYSGGSGYYTAGCNGGDSEHVKAFNIHELLRTNVMGPDLENFGLGGNYGTGLVKLDG